MSGCSTVPPASHPAVPVPGAYPLALAAPAETAVQMGWQDFFTDTEMRSLIYRALDNNRDLQAAAARIAQARADVSISGADLAPQVSGSAGMAKVGVPDALARMLRDDTLTSYNGLLQARWEIDLFGRLRKLQAAARERYLASAEARRGLATSLVAQVAAGYLADREYAERLALAHETLANRERALHMLTRRYEVGSGSKIDVTQAETLRTQAAAEIPAIELARAQNRDALAVLVGEPIADSALQHSLAQVGLTQQIRPGLPSALLANRPDIVATEHRLRAAEANIGAARAAFFPSISLTGIAGSSSRDLDGLFGAGTGLWLFRPSISLPIFTAGKLRANLRLSEARRDEMLAAYEATIQGAFRDVADALAQRHWLAEQITTIDQSIVALSERSRLAQLRYDAGRSAFLEVLDAERDRFSAEQKRIQLRRAWLASGVALYAALGGGFSEPEPQRRNP
ncbi:RND transporter [Sphingomonas panacis]|uniref:RND transporter n=2 Tax=Sphingomonas panacis TaxID=1560345 RepID=A0A1B3Z5D0_9SPHN|nr:RND transporter [Sphingomonas panacis]